MLMTLPSSGRRPDLNYPAQEKPPEEPQDEPEYPPLLLDWPWEETREIRRWVSWELQPGHFGESMSLAEKLMIFSNSFPQSLHSYS
jgi:hypothetical protein